MGFPLKSIALAGLAAAILAAAAPDSGAAGLIADWTCNQVDTGGQGYAVADVGGHGLTGYTDNSDLGAYWGYDQNSTGKIGGYVCIDNALGIAGFTWDTDPYFNVADPSYRLSGMNGLTVNSWIYLPDNLLRVETPALYVYNKPGSYTLGVTANANQQNNRQFFATINGITVSTSVAGSGFSYTNYADVVGSPYYARWYLFSATYDGAAGIARLYLNGNSLGTATGTAGNVPTTSESLHVGTGPITHVGQYYNTYSNAWCGGLDDLSVWDQTLSAAQIKAVYNIPGLLASYDAAHMSTLFGVFDTGTAALVDGQIWVRASGLSGHAAGDAWTADGQYYVQLDGSGAGVRTIARMAGDANSDSAVDILDLNKVLTNFDKTGIDWSGGDFDGDRTVTIIDLNKVLTNFDKTSSASAGIRAVPEPGTLAILVAGLLTAATVGYRRRIRLGLWPDHVRWGKSVMHVIGMFHESVLHPLRRRDTMRCALFVVGLLAVVLMCGSAASAGVIVYPVNYSFEADSPGTSPPTGWDAGTVVSAAGLSGATGGQSVLLDNGGGQTGQFMNIPIQDGYSYELLADIAVGTGTHLEYDYTTCVEMNLTATDSGGSIIDYPINNAYYPSQITQAAGNKTDTFATISSGRAGPSSDPTSYGYTDNFLGDYWRVSVDVLWGANDYGSIYVDNVRFVVYYPKNPGDANRDGVVNIEDLSKVLANYDKNGMTWDDGDFNGDGKVDISDLSNLLSNYDKTFTASAGVKAVPEPGTLALLAAGLVGLVAGARRR
jgi:hypothetical protein